MCFTIWNFKPTSSSSFLVAQTVPTTLPRNISKPFIVVYTVQETRWFRGALPPWSRGATTGGRARHRGAVHLPGLRDRPAGLGRLWRALFRPLLRPGWFRRTTPFRYTAH